MKSSRTRHIERLEEQLTVLRGESLRLRGEAAALLTDLTVLAREAEAAAARLVDEATEGLAALARREAGPLWLGWASGEWGRQGGLREGLVTHVRTGSRRDEPPLPQEQARADLAAFAPLLAAEGPVLVIGDLRTQELGRKVMQSLLLRTALGMPQLSRFTLIDPLGLGAAFPFRGDLAGRVRAVGHTVADELTEVVEDIRRIHEHVLKGAPRLADLPAEERAGEQFELIAVADFPRAYLKDPRAVDLLVRIARAGPRAGRHLLLEINLDIAMPHGFGLSELELAVPIDVRAGPSLPALELDVPPPPRRQSELIQATSRAARGRRPEWSRAVRPPSFLTGSAATRLETPLGERVRFWLGVDADGAHSSHAVIAGQTGSGKSQLLHVLITGLAARHGPQELELVLIGSGMELCAYRRLPQARIICVRTQAATARSVLIEQVADMEERYELLHEAGAADLEEYRSRGGRLLPRRLVVIEEYPQLLSGEEEQGGAPLTRLLEKGRAAGIHVVLIAQTFSTRGLPSAALTHIHTRMALSLPPDYVQGLPLFGPEGRRLIRDLEAPGQIVVNDRSGRDGANQTGFVAQLDRAPGHDTVQEVIQEIIRAHGSPGQPLLLDGREAAVVTDNPFVKRWMGAPPAPAAQEAVARQRLRKGGFGMPAWSAADRPLPLWLGRRFDVHGHALAALRRAPAENLLVLGPQREVRHCMLASALAALPAFLAPGALEITLLSGLGPDVPAGRMLLAICEQLAAQGARLVVAREGGLDAPLSVLTGAGADSARTRLLVIAEPETLTSLHRSPEHFAPPAGGPAAHLRAVLSHGPQHGTHVILSTASLASLGTVLSPLREARHFNHRVMQPMSEEDSMTLLASLAAARIGSQADHPFAALLVDQSLGARTGVVFASYAAARDVSAPQDLATLRECLGALTRTQTAAHVA